MKYPSLGLSLVLLSCGVPAALAADRAVITVANDGGQARPAEVIVIPYADVLKVIPDLRMHHFRVRHAKSSAEIPSQVTNYEHDHRGANYNDLVFGYDFAPGETSAEFIVEKSDAPVLPYETKTFARYAPDRYDDFAWENDRVAFRMYGPTIESNPPEKERLRSSGVDVWAKRVTYPIVNRWYDKGHDQFHKDTGEGYDIYSVGPERGAGGAGVWDGATLHTSGNWRTWKILTNGPIRTVFELTYEPWQAGALRVAETKRFTVDAGRSLNLVESTFTIEGGAEATIAIGICKPRGKAKLVAMSKDERAGWLSVWQSYAEEDAGNLGVGIVVPGATGFAEEKGNFLLLAKVKNGDTLRYYQGAGWDQTPHFSNQPQWEAYLGGFAARASKPVKATIAEAR